jgi:hypothetical protein
MSHRSTSRSMIKLSDARTDNLIYAAVDSLFQKCMVAPRAEEPRGVIAINSLDHSGSHRRHPAVHDLPGHGHQRARDQHNRDHQESGHLQIQADEQAGQDHRVNNQERDGTQP